MSTPESAICQIAQLPSLLSSGGFHLSKFTSNCRLILFSIPETDRSVCNAVDIINDLLVSKTLELVWNTSSNTLKIKVNVKEKPCTRRGLLSIISQVYDPLRLVQPFVLPMKRHLQMLNLESLSWDDLLPESLQVDWNTWLSQLPCLQELAIPRCFKPTGFISAQMELHCFSDGSQVGYGAVAYLRMVSPSGQIYCSFIMGKSRVAPIKPVTISRVELTAAVVAVRLAHFIRKELEFKLDKTAVLHDIANTATRYQTFVANQLKVIHDLSTMDEWWYVSTHSNPADLASRGAYPNKYKDYESWFHGPPFLRSTEACWPVSPLILSLPDDIAEVKGGVNILQVH